MKEKLLSVARTTWDAIKSPVGLAIISAIAGAKANDLFSENKQSKELEDAQTDRKKLTDRVSQLEGQNGELSNLGGALLAKNGELRDELRQIDKKLTLTENHLSGATYAFDTAITAFKSSWCFWRQPVRDAKEVIASPDKSSVPQLR